MAREVTYDPQLQRLMFFPIIEMSALRRSVLGRASPGVVVVPSEPLTLATGANVLQSELRASFAVPTQPVRLGVTLLHTKRGASTKIFIDFYPDPSLPVTDGAAGSHWNVTAGVDQSSMMCPNYVKNAPPPSHTNRTACMVRSLCIGSEPQAFTFVCFSSYPVAIEATALTTNCEDARVRQASNGTLMLKPSDRTLEFAVWTDNLFVEIFLMGGRLAWTVPLPCEAIVGGVGATAFVSGLSDDTVLDRGVELLNATVWEMGSIVYDDIGGPDNRS